MHYTSALRLVTPICGGLVPSDESHAIKGYYRTLSAGLAALASYVRTNGHSHIVLASPSTRFVWYLPSWGETAERVDMQKR